MKVLWYTRVFFPDLSKELGINKTVVGGWTYSLARDIISPEVDLHVATTSTDFSDFQKNINDISYYVIKSRRDRLSYDGSLESKFRDLVQMVEPDVIHIHGTEYAHGLAIMRACPDANFVVSIQGLVGVYAKYYLGGIKTKDILRNLTFRDIFKADSLLQQQNKFAKRGILEQEYLRKTKHILGRTSWDYAHAMALNPECTYYHCNRTLRFSFYNSRKWEISKIRRNTIFLSQAGYPLKGLHKVLEAMAILKKDFPEISIRIGGNNITRNESFMDKLRIRGYGKYINSLLKRYDLEETVMFLGMLDEEEMINEYLNAHVFICPSSIENSPNSLGEAQILGTPVIASYVGGARDMVTDGVTGLLYRFEESEELAVHIRNVFENDTLATTLSENGIVDSEKRHNRAQNNRDILNAYRLIANSNKSRPIKIK